MLILMEQLVRYQIILAFAYTRQNIKAYHLFQYSNAWYYKARRPLHDNAWYYKYSDLG